MVTSLVTVLAVTVTTSLAFAAMVVSSTFAIHSSYLLPAAESIKVVFFSM